LTRLYVLSSTDAYVVLLYNTSQLYLILICTVKKPCWFVT